MHIVYDEHNDEYGVLKNKSFKDSFIDISKTLEEARPNLTPDHIFYSEDEVEVPKKEDLNFMPDINIPTVHFYDKNNEVYDTAMYTSKIATNRYKIIKEIKNMKEFFDFKKQKGSN